MPDKLTYNEIAREVERQAPFICCPMCDEKECVGRDTCTTLKDFVKRMVQKNDRQRNN